MAAGDRTKKIISRVRLRNGALTIGSAEDEQIIDFGNQIQIDMMVKLRCVENPKEVALVDGTATYTLDNYHGRIKEIIPSWEGGGIAYIDNGKWNNYEEAVGSKPLYATIFGNLLYLAPAPEEEGLTLTLWIHQKMYTAAMSKTVDPETPEFLDQILELGILALYDAEKFEAKYERYLRSYSPTTHQKQNKNYKVAGDWMEPNSIRIEQFEE